MQDFSSVAIARDRENRDTPNSGGDPPPEPSADSESESAGHAPAKPADSPATADASPAVSPVGQFDRRLIKDSFSRLMADPAATMEYFYARLFAANSELRGLFPLAMQPTRVAVFKALARLIWSLDDREATERILRQIAVDHRKSGVKEKHYLPFFEALISTARNVIGADWTPELNRAWRAAVSYFASVMSAAAATDAKRTPAWWLGEIVQHELRTPTIAVLLIRPDQPLNYLPGQYVAMQVPKWPRVWRKYSIANAPTETGLLEFHVRAVPGGMLSTSLVDHCDVGDTVVLGPARGEMVESPESDRDLVCVAGGTGLAPIKAIVDGVMRARRPGKRRNITLYFGVKGRDELYDMQELENFGLGYPSLCVIPVVEREIDYEGRIGRLPNVVSEHSSFRDTDVYVSGPAGLISATIRALAGRVPSERMHHDPLDALRVARRPQRADYLRN